MAQIEPTAQDLTDRIVARMAGRDRRRMKRALAGGLRAGESPEAAFHKLAPDLLFRFFTAAQATLAELEGG